MTLSVEDRLAAAGEQLDALVDLEQPIMLGIAQRTGREPRTAAMLVSLCAVVLVAVGLVWATRPDEPVEVPAANTSDPTPTVSNTTTPPVATPTSEASSSSVPAAPIPPVASTTIPFDERQPLAIGESVMKGAIPQLQEGGFELFVEESWQGDDVAEVVEQLETAGQLGRVVVIQTGTNGPVSADVYRRIADALVDVDQVVFLTVHANRAWIPGNNALIWSLPSQYPNVKVLDWDGLVSSGAVPGMAGDGIHLGTLDAQQLYANYVFGVIGRNDLVRPYATQASPTELDSLLPAISPVAADFDTGDLPRMTEGDVDAEVVTDAQRLCLRLSRGGESVGGGCNNGPSAGLLALGTTGADGVRMWFFLTSSTVAIEGAYGCPSTSQTSAGLTLTCADTTNNTDPVSIVFVTPDGRRYVTTLPGADVSGPVTP